MDIVRIKEAFPLFPIFLISLGLIIFFALWYRYSERCPKCGSKFCVGNFNSKMLGCWKCKKVFSPVSKGAWKQLVADAKRIIKFIDDVAVFIFVECCPGCRSTNVPIIENLYGSVNKRRCMDCGTEFFSSSVKNNRFV